MQPYELSAAVDGVENARHTSWEQTRAICRVMASAMGCKIEEDFMRFPWDNPREEIDVDTAAAASLEFLKRYKARNEQHT